MSLRWNPKAKRHETGDFDKLTKSIHRHKLVDIAVVRDHRPKPMDFFLASYGHHFFERHNMAPISEELRNALPALDHQIQAAEQFLAKDIGGEIALVRVKLDLENLRHRLLADDPAEGLARDDLATYMAFNGEKLVLRALNTSGEKIGEISYSDLPLSQRVILSKYVAELIQASLSQQEELAEAALASAGLIEHALALSDSSAEVRQCDRINLFMATHGWLTLDQIAQQFPDISKSRISSHLSHLKRSGAAEHDSTNKRWRNIF